MRSQSDSPDRRPSAVKKLFFFAGPGGRFAQRLYREVADSDSGTALVEFAVSALVFLMMLFGSMEGFLAVYSHNFVADAARRACRYAIVRGSNCTGMSDCNITQAQIQSYIRGNPYPGIRMNQLTATVTWLNASSTQPTTWSTCGTPPCNIPGNAVQVTVTYAFPIGIWAYSNITISSTSQMVIYN
jgi:Flp pilus assembly protein TadG